MINRVISFCILALIFRPLQAQFKLDLEGGVIPGTNYNYVRIPDIGGTLVDVSDQLEAKPKIFYRVRAGYTITLRDGNSWNLDFNSRDAGSAG